MLGAEIVRAERSNARTLDAVAGWGLRPTATRARAFAARHDLPYVALEDGFLRSFGTGETYPPLSIVADTIGIYYDGTRESGLERLLNSNTDFHARHGDIIERARTCIADHGLSKYNSAPRGALPAAIDRADNFVLVIDQTFGDKSIEYGSANAASFESALQAARDENPDALVVLKTHPEVSAGRKRGYLGKTRNDERLLVLREPVNPFALAAAAARVYVVTSTMGFEALLAGTPVSCFGRPWYSGWGATDDRVAPTRRERRRNVDDLFAAAYLDYARYLDPFTHGRGSILDVINWLNLQHETRDRLIDAGGHGRLICVGFQRWKAHNMKPQLGFGGTRTTFVHDDAALERLEVEATDRIAVWGARASAGTTRLAGRTEWSILRIEDGFYRSVGLGSDLLPASSLVFDAEGMYFDPGAPSALERMLNETDFSPESLERARAVIDFIVERRLTKYNLEPPEAPAWEPGARRVVLVPGQVEDDASVELGTNSIGTNLDLLRAAREDAPDAFIVYKPHPDVLAGNRAGAVEDAQARRYADHVETACAVVGCVEAADTVCTMTSLAGFEALLRSKDVVTHGEPFYAGWGLTDDRITRPVALARRRRTRSLEELVAAALIQYPAYWDWTLNGYTTCEAALAELAARRDAWTRNGYLADLRRGGLIRLGSKARTFLAAWLKPL